MNVNLSSIDIVVPCYNYGRYLRSCVRSILHQSDVIVRVLIIDDASSDETADVGQALAKEDSRVTFSESFCEPRQHQYLQRRHTVGFGRFLFAAFRR